MILISAFVDVLFTVCCVQIRLTFCNCGCTKVFKNQSENDVELCCCEVKTAAYSQIEEVLATDVPSLAAAFSNIDPDLVGALC